MTPTNKALTAAMAIALTGCSFNPIGESRFDCNRKEHPSEYCRSFKALVKSTDGPLPESRFDREFRMSDYDRATGIAPITATSATIDRNGTTNSDRLPHQRINTFGDPVAGMPIRQAPIVQRVFIKRFVDDNDSLLDDVIVYREVKGARWSGFEVSGRDEYAPGAYPHRSHDSSTQETDANVLPSQTTNLAQPGGVTDGVAGSAMSPAGSQSGDVYAQKAER